MATLPSIILAYNSLPGAIKLVSMIHCVAISCCYEVSVYYWFCICKPKA